MARFNQNKVLSTIGRKKPNSSGWIRINCPFCLENVGTIDRGETMGINAGSGRCHCFRCDAWGFIKPRLIGKMEDVPLAPKPAGPMAPLDGFLPLATRSAQDSLVLRPIWEYLKSRDVSYEAAEGAHIGTCLEGRFINRVIVPLRDVAGKWFGYVARHINPSHPRRYLNSAGQVDLLFNQCALSVETDIPLIVVEGIFDALPLWPNALALLGKSSERRIEILMTAKRPLVIALDGDAWKEGEALAWRLQLEGLTVGFVKLPPKTDPFDHRHSMWKWAIQSLEG